MGGSTFDSTGQLAEVFGQWASGSLTKIAVEAPLQKWVKDEGINSDQGNGLRLLLGLGFAGIQTGWLNDLSYKKNFLNLLTNGGYSPSVSPSPSPSSQYVPETSTQDRIIL
ncbi:MAG: hypothetical protein NDI63_04265 [Pseudobdellovibrio sp.]|nr:hypothetical protein [Pseudobdellovibrio sp.]